MASVPQDHDPHRAIVLNGRRVPPALSGSPNSELEQPTTMTIENGERFPVTFSSRDARLEA